MDYRDLCKACYLELPLLGDHCRRCALPLIGTNAEPLCGQCLQEKHFFEKIYALYLYQMPIAKLILELKFNQALSHARVLGELLGEKIKQDWYHNQPLPELIVPVPLHPNRLKERGFNQALEIARAVANTLNLPLNFLNCTRIKETMPQAMHKANERRLNVKNAFWIDPPCLVKHVAIVDDVITTGSTVSELSRVFKEQGVSLVDVWCIARATLS